MPGQFFSKDKLARAQNAVVANGGDKENWVLVLKEYQKLGGAYRDDPGDPLLPQLEMPAKTDKPSKKGTKMAKKKLSGKKKLGGKKKK